MAKVVALLQQGGGARRDHARQRQRNQPRVDADNATEVAGYPAYQPRGQPAQLHKVFQLPGEQAAFLMWRIALDAQFEQTLSAQIRWMLWRWETALTALAHGGLCSLLSALYPGLAAVKPDIRVTPCFDDRPALSGAVNLSITISAWALAVALLRLRWAKRSVRHVQSGRPQGCAAR